MYYSKKENFWQGFFWDSGFQGIQHSENVPIDRTVVGTPCWHGVKVGLR